MSRSAPQPVKKEHVGAIAGCSLLIFVVQFVARGLDDNRLTRWQWAFAVADGPTLFLVLAAVLALSMALFVPFVRMRPRPIFLFVVSFAVSAVFWGEPEVVVDASRYFTQAKHLEVYGVRRFLEAWGGELAAWTDMPLVPFIYGLIFRVCGEARMAIQVFNSLLFSGTVALTALIGGRLWDEETGFVAGLLLLGVPYLFTQVPLMLVDTAVMFLIVLSVYLFIEALRGGGWMIPSAAISIAAAVYSKYSAWLMLSVLVMVVAAELYRVRSDPEGRRRCMMSCLGVGLIAGCIAAVVFLSKYGFFVAQMKLLNGYQRPGLRRWGESFVSTFLFQTHPVVTVAAAIGTLAALRRRDPSFLVALWMVLLVFVLQIRRIRYVIMVFPMLALMASYGAALWRGTEIRRYAALCVVLSSIVMAAGAYLPFLKGYSAANLAEAGVFLDTLPEAAVVVYTPVPADPVLNPAVGVALLDLHTHKRIFYPYDPRELRQPAEKVATSSLRFTWEYRNPVYYGGKVGDDMDAAVVVISAEKGGELPPSLSVRLSGYGLVKGFEVTEGIFSNQTFVYIYRKTAKSA